MGAVCPSCGEYKLGTLKCTICFPIRKTSTQKTIGISFHPAGKPRLTGHWWLDTGPEIFIQWELLLVQWLTRLSKTWMASISWKTSKVCYSSEKEETNLWHVTSFFLPICISCPRISNPPILAPNPRKLCMPKAIFTPLGKIKKKSDEPCEV